MWRKLVVISLFLSIISCAAGWQKEMATNNRNIAKLEIGMKMDDALNIMGEPLLREAYAQDDGSVFEAIFYYTNRVLAAGNQTKDEMTPICFVDKVLIGWGQNFYTTNITVYNR